MTTGKEQIEAEPRDLGLLLRKPFIDIRDIKELFVGRGPSICIDNGFLTWRAFNGLDELLLEDPSCGVTVDISESCAATSLGSWLTFWQSS
jgi:hypothetical protein